MKPSVALERHLAIVLETIKRHPKFKNPQLFGSVLEGTDKEGSDVDILIEGHDRISLFDLVGLEHQLSEILGVPVDLREPGELSVKFRQKVLDQAIPLEMFKRLFVRKAG